MKINLQFIVLYIKLSAHDPNGSFCAIHNIPAGTINASKQMLCSRVMRTEESEYRYDTSTIYLTPLFTLYCNWTVPSVITCHAEAVS